MDTEGESRDPIIDNVIKAGVLRKGKKGKKRFFVLRQEMYSSPARIDCYESEKRFRLLAAPKQSVLLKSCFNINKKRGAAPSSPLRCCLRHAASTSAAAADTSPSRKITASSHTVHVGKFCGGGRHIVATVAANVKCQHASAVSPSCDGQ